jgi:Flp pilus assembly protein TadG
VNTLGRWVIRRLRSRRTEQLGYLAITVALLVPVVFIGCAAIAVDMSRWSVEAERVQRAADAAALAGVVWMPADFTTAKSTALATSAKNGYDDAVSSVAVTVSEGDKPSQLVVTVSSTISNSFGAAIGAPRTTVSRSATADYAGGLAMGSPCNEFGSDPDPTSTANKSANCSDAGGFWANVGSRAADKQTGDAFQDNVCTASPTPDGCTSSSGPNRDYDPNGYIYEVSVASATTNLQLQAFDPALIAVGDNCSDNLSGASAIPAAKAAVTDPSTRYVSGNGSYCTGDNDFSGSTGTNQVNTSYTVRMMNTGSDPTRPWTWPALTTGDCPGATTYPGYDGNLATALKTDDPGYKPAVSATFRRWVTLCSLSSVPKDATLAIQVKTNGNGFDTANGHNRFALRGYSTSSPSAKDAVSIAAFNKMAIYTNVASSSTTKFFLTRVPTTAAGRTLDVRLYDIGDITGTGTLKIVAPTESGTTFSNCRAVGPVNSTLTNCQFNASSAFQGKWEDVYVPIPSTYHCTDASATGCWVKLWYDLSGATAASDTTSWSASIDGDPVRLIK